MKKDQIKNTSQEDRGAESTNKKEYKMPKIIQYGKLKDITLGGSPGTGDSGNPFVELPPG